AMYQCENGSGGSDAEGQCRNRSEREPRRFAKLAQTVTDVLQNGLETHRATALAAIFLDLFHATELDSREAAGLTLCDAGTYLVGDLGLEMESQFLIQLQFHSPAGK